MTSLLAQESAVQSYGLWRLFAQSFDFFSVVLITGSIAAVAIIVRCVMDIRPSRILPERSVETIRGLLRAGRLAELKEFTRTDVSFPSRVLHAAAAQVRPGDPDSRAAREAAELAASEECAAWFRRVEPLNIIGNLGPLVGLAGTVWGMILAFTSLGVSGGQASPAELSLGISKALFHTLLGLTLATPCLLVFGFYRSVIDRVCTRAMVVSSELLEALLNPEAGS
jgi:biopolymer transport protein ExbB